MTKTSQIHEALSSTIRFYNSSLGRKGEVSFRSPFLSELEHKFISYILNSEELRPKMYKLKKTNEFISIDNLLIPKSYDNYKHLFNTKQLYSKYKIRLVSNNILIETDYGFILNHKYFPFNDRNTMSYLRKLISMPLPPPK